jgi:glycosyltransferase involved in cell wall biosynthesis
MKTEYPLISVVMPVYNHEKYVEQALNSILNQTYPNLEIIIIDDGSKDKSCAKIEETLEKWNRQPHQLKRKIEFIKQENRGAHNTINRGLTMAQGEWLTILNSDDYFHLDRIDILLQQTQASKAEISFTYVLGIDEKNQSLPDNHWWVRWYEGVRFDLFSAAPTVGFMLLEHNFAVSTGNLFFSRHLFEKVGLFKDLKLAHDLDFILRTISLTEPLLIKENLYFYRIHSHNTQHQVSHLAKKELAEIYSEFLLSVSSTPPKNKQAPCHWYWPTAFAKTCEKLHIHHGLEKFLIKIPSEKNVPKTKSMAPAQATSKNIPFTLISHEMSLSGAPKLLADLALCLKANGYAPHVISMTDGPMKEELEKNGVPVYVVNKPGSKGNSLKSLLFTLCFRIKGRVIANSIMSWPLVIPLTLLRPKSKPIWYIHETISLPGVMRGVRRKIVTPFLKLCKKYAPPRLWFGCSATSKSWDYSEFPKGKVMYWSGIPKQTVQPKHRSALKNLLSVGSVSPRKGTHTLIDAFFQCLEEGRIPNDTTLSIVGFPKEVNQTDPLLADIILKVVTSKFRENVRMIQSVSPDQLDSFFAEADLFIQSSVMECLPIALLTAMSLGLPIITTNVDGCAEVIEDHKTGYLCLPYDVNSLANAIAEAINHPNQSTKMGEKAQEVFNEKFCLEITSEKFLAEINNS